MSNFIPTLSNSEREYINGLSLSFGLKAPKTFSEFEHLKKVIRTSAENALVANNYSAMETNISTIRAFTPIFEKITKDRNNYLANKEKCKGNLEKLLQNF